MFEFGEWVVGHELCAFHKSWVVYLCTCARAHRASASREWLGRWCSNLVFGLGVINKVLSTSHGWGASARAHVRTPFPCLGNCWVHCAEIWWVIRVPVAMCFMQVFGWAPLHVRTCTPYLRISRTDWPIVLKFDVWLDTQMLRGLQKLEVGWLHIRTYVSSFVVTETAEPCPWSRTKNRFHVHVHVLIRNISTVLWLFYAHVKLKSRELMSDTRTRIHTNTCTQT